MKTSAFGLKKYIYIIDQVNNYRLFTWSRANSCSAALHILYTGKGGEHLFHTMFTSPSKICLSVRLDRFYFCHYWHL